MGKNKTEHSEKNKVRCYCPKCEKHHFKNIFWTGRAKVPWIFCDYCRNYEIENIVAHSISADGSGLIKKIN